jgi:hypothetical protein
LGAAAQKYLEIIRLLDIVLLAKYGNIVHVNSCPLNVTFEKSNND